MPSIATVAKSNAIMSARYAFEGTRVHRREGVHHRRHISVGMAGAGAPCAARRCTASNRFPQYRTLVRRNRCASRDGAGAHGGQGSCLQEGRRRRYATSAFPVELSEDRRLGRHYNPQKDRQARQNETSGKESVDHWRTCPETSTNHHGLRLLDIQLRQRPSIGSGSWSNLAKLDQMV